MLFLKYYCSEILNKYKSQNLFGPEYSGTLYSGKRENGLLINPEPFAHKEKRSGFFIIELILIVLM